MAHPNTYEDHYLRKRRRVANLLSFGIPAAGAAIGAAPYLASKAVSGIAAKARDYIKSYSTMPPKRSFSQAVGSQDLSQLSSTQTSAVLNSLYSGQEVVDRKRSPPVKFRLHPAKYLEMDKMLKSMFFPTMTTKLRFGMSSFTGVNLKDMTDFVAGMDAGQGAASAHAQLRARGLYRGVAMFTIRDTNFDVGRTSDNALNSKSLQVGEAVADTRDNTIFTPYRRFLSSPQAPGGLDAANVSNTPITLTANKVGLENEIRCLSLGTNLNDIEENAVGGMVYTDPFIAQDKFFNTAKTLEASNTGLVNNENPPVGTSAATMVGPTANTYYSYMKDSVIRIQDGYVHLDIMNTELTPCVVEVVLHSRKKTTLSTNEIYRTLWNDVNRHLTAKASANHDLDPSAIVAGGWQAFFDPNYPLMKFNSKAQVADYLNEVHRSNHVLAPGQSKTVKIALGSLWYRVGNKYEYEYNTSAAPAPQTITKFKENVGSLICSIGHSGFEYPQAVTGIQDLSTVQIDPSTSGGTTGWGNTAGSGFWVGKSHAPSSISIDGTYQDKFYPATFDRTPNSVINNGNLRQATFGGAAGAAVPLATIVPERVATNLNQTLQSVTGNPTAT